MGVSCGAKAAYYRLPPLERQAMLDPSARKAAAVSLAAGALIGAWQVGVDLLDNSEDARALRIGGVALLLLFSILVLIWGFWRGNKGARVARKLKLRIREGSTRERVRFEIRSREDLRGKAILISCNAPIRLADFETRHLVQRATYRMIRGSHSRDEDSIRKTYKVGDLIELTPKQLGNFSGRVELVDQRLGSMELVGGTSSAPSDIRKTADQYGVIFDFSHEHFTDSFMVIWGTLVSDVHIEITSVKWTKLRK